MPALRIGHGYDIHRIVSGRPLVLGGVRFATDYGLDGHSDADCITHAICDALDRLRPRSDGKSYREQISFVADRPGHDHRYAIDPTKLDRELGWQARESFETGIEKTIAWYLANEAWWAPILARSDAGQRLGLKTVSA